MEAHRHHENTAFGRFAYHAAALQVCLAGGRFQRLLAKANFDAGEPRVPAGAPDGGQWTGVGSGSYRLPSGARVIRVGDGPAIFRMQPGMLEDDEPSARDFPDIPVERPSSRSDRYTIIRSLPMAPYIGRPGRSLPQALESAGAPAWLKEYYPHIDAYTGPPKTLSELQNNASISRPGYDVHHIVEKGPALADGFTSSMVNGPENLVSIPRFKHWEITGLYTKKDETLGGISLREYLRKQDWIARYNFGLDALERFKVIK